MTAIEKAKALRASLRAELARVEQFIQEHAAFENGSVPERKIARKAPLFVKGHKDEVLEQIIGVLESAPERLRTAEITARIIGSGFVIVAQNPAAYVGTIIHRNQDKIDRTRDGSCLRREPTEQPNVKQDQP